MANAQNVACSGSWKRKMPVPNLTLRTALEGGERLREGLTGWPTGNYGQRADQGCNRTRKKKLL
jgi:hypothetical protein